MADAIPGTPTMPVPSTLMSATWSMVAKPLTAEAAVPDSALSVSRSLTWVPAGVAVAGGGAGRSAGWGRSSGKQGRL